MQTFVRVTDTKDPGHTRLFALRRPPSSTCLSVDRDVLCWCPSPRLQRSNTVRCVFSGSRVSSCCSRRQVRSHRMLEITVPLSQTACSNLQTTATLWSQTLKARQKLSCIRMQTFVRVTDRRDPYHTRLFALRRPPSSTRLSVDRDVLCWCPSPESVSG